MPGRRPPRTSYGYLAPPGAVVVGWECRRDGCGTGDVPAPRWWPHPCAVCHRPADPVFDQPWAHQAEGHKHRHDLASPDWRRRTVAELRLPVWAYRDAWFRGDRPAAEAAWRSFWQTRRRQRDRGEDWYAVTATGMILTNAATFGDLDRAARKLLAWHPLVETRDVENDNEQRTEARVFVAVCIEWLVNEASVGHAREAAVNAAMRDVADRIRDVLNPAHHEGFRRIREQRALRHSRTVIADNRRSDAVIRGGLPTAGLPGVAVEALTALTVHDDPGPLDALVGRLPAAGETSDLRRLLLAHRHAAAGELPAALAALETATETRDDPLRPGLGPQLYATLGMLRVLADPAALNAGIADCRAGRRLGLRWWRRATAADASLARLLLWRALRADRPAGRREADVREAVRLARRRCRPWHHPGAEDQVVRHDALATRDALSGQRPIADRHRAWMRAVDAPRSTTERARLAAAWAEWAVGTGDQELAADAYQHLVGLVPLDAAARYGPGAKQRVLAAAQEHTEEAGYWLARAGRYREAAVALETGRAVGLSEVTGRDGTAVVERLRAAGRAELAEAYRNALAELDEQERTPGPRLRRAWTQARTVAREVAAVTGVDPLALDVTYDDVTAVTGDGAIVYLAAARGGGYALVVAARHDPQLVMLPTFDRARVAGLVDTLLPGPGDGDSNGDAPGDGDGAPRGGDNQGGGGREGGRGRGVARDLAPMRPWVDPLTAVLGELWEHCLRDLLLGFARGRTVTLVPVGLLSMLPLHAAGRATGLGDGHPDWWHAGDHSAIRYAPNARGLRRCRETARDLSAGPDRLLAVDVPGGAGAEAYLWHVARETTEVTRRWSPDGTLRHDCTWAEFRDAAEEHTVWHLACHGSARPRAILDSRLYFADREVTLGELRQALRPGRRRLAVLSACETNLTATALPNEVLGLPSALLQVGFAGVVASSWRVDDLATAYLMTAFHQQWRGGGHEPALALNLAQRWLRTATPADLTGLLPGTVPGGDGGPCPYRDPRYWAAFAYTGA
ncbi:CHAT domain-containing protein [Micromonospora sp. WMMD882]|uniref:CHAT domain-containing protein n=1 Tax=Micromonospora sp. WMMD882 TaxID=3015151 RepID=UPI00248B45B6|nr:CHAT domain-containing protein [Micromonospora sp. WMMD882]WBB78752.1 CHAT domain-containing protein [Micromonospora sp. WMMD882]